jgi:hypothetical protein
VCNVWVVGECTMLGADPTYLATLHKVCYESAMSSIRTFFHRAMHVLN